MTYEIGCNSVKSNTMNNNEFFINPSVEELKDFASKRVMKDFQKNLGPEDQQPILTESERFAAIKKEKDEFDNRKKIAIKGLPAEIKAEDVSALLETYHVGPIQLEKVESSTNAVVLLGSGQEAQAAVRELDGFLYNGTPLQCSMAVVDSLLCITNLPLSYTQENVRRMCEVYGPVDRCFVMPSEETGNSKGYAFVEYPNKEIARKAKAQLSGRLIQTHEINCDWTDEHHCFWNKLHSTCLLAELTADFNDTTKFRSLFNKIADPRYIQLALNSETRKCLGFGIVAFENPLVTEQTWYKVNGANVYGQNLRVYFVCPGHSGRNEYTRRLAKCQKKTSQAVVGAPLFQNVAQLPNGGLLNPLLMAKFASASSPVMGSVSLAAFQNSPSPGIAAHTAGGAPAVSLAQQLASQNHALQLAAAQQAAALGGVQGNASLLAAAAAAQQQTGTPHQHVYASAASAHPGSHAFNISSPVNAQSSHVQQQLAAAHASLLSQHQSGSTGGAPTAATLQQLQLAAAAQQQPLSAGVYPTGAATGALYHSSPHHTHQQQDLAQAQMLALAAAATASSGKDRSSLLAAVHSPTALSSSSNSSNCSSTSTISHNTSAANSLIQHNAQLKALGLLSAHSAATADLMGATANGAATAGMDSSTATLLAALAHQQQQQQQHQHQQQQHHQQQQIAALAASGAFQLGSVGYQGMGAGGGMELLQQAAFQQQQQQQQLLAAAMGSSGAFSTGLTLAGGGAMGGLSGLSQNELSSLLYAAQQQQQQQHLSNQHHHHYHQQQTAAANAYISAEQVVYDTSSSSSSSNAAQQASGNAVVSSASNSAQQNNQSNNMAALEWFSGYG